MSAAKVAARERMALAKQAILLATDDDSFWDVIEHARDAFRGVRVLYASNAAGEPMQDILSNGKYLASLFGGRGLLAFSDEIETAMCRGEAKIMFATRPLIDTNLYSDLPKALSGQTSTTGTHLAHTLQQTTQAFGKDSLDWTFAALENIREAANPHNPWPLRKSAAAHHYLAHGLTKPSADDFAEFRPLAQTQWDDWLKSEHIWHQVHRRDTVYLVLLCTFIEAWSGSKPVDDLQRLMIFCMEHLGTMPLKELYFAWKILRGVDNPALAMPIFSEPCMKQVKPASLGRISALAWDLFLFRWCETQMTQRVKVSSDTATFYLPAVTTLDIDLLSAIRACPLKALLVNDDAGIVESVFADELPFHDCLNQAMTASLHKQWADPVRRAQAGHIDPRRIDDCIRQVEMSITNKV
jgi:hypothetical protein